MSVRHRYWCLCRGAFNVTIADGSKHAADTYLHTSRLGRGHAWINGHNIGRFWTKAGPQQALFVPGVWLQEGQNEVVVLEIELSVGGHPLVWFDSKPDFSGGRLGKRGGTMLGGLLHQAWMMLHDRGHETFFAMDTLKRQLGVM